MHDATRMHDAFIGEVGQSLLQAAEGRRLATERHADQHHAVTDNVTLVEPRIGHAPSQQKVTCYVSQPVAGNG